MKSIFCLFLLVLSQLALAEIIDGVEDNQKEYENVYKIAFKSSGDIYPHCTATIIDDYTVLTAAHCTDQIRAGKRLKLLIEGRSYKVLAISIPNAYYSLSKAFYDSQDRLDLDPLNSALQLDYAKKHKAVTQYDIALIKLKYKLSKLFKKTRLNFQKQYEGTAVTAVGYGYLSYEQTPSGIIYNNPLNPFYRLETISRNEEFIELFSRSIDDQITSAGDSGSPLLLESKEQVGVLRGININSNYISSIYAPLSLHIEFIKNNLHKEKR